MHAEQQSITKVLTEGHLQRKRKKQKVDQTKDERTKTNKNKREQTQEEKAITSFSFLLLMHRFASSGILIITHLNNLFPTWKLWCKNESMEKRNDKMLWFVVYGRHRRRASLLYYAKVAFWEQNHCLWNKPCEYFQVAFLRCVETHKCWETIKGHMVDIEGRQLARLLRLK